MLDRALNAALRQPLQRLARQLLRAGVQADHLTWAGFAVGMLAVPLIASGHSGWALLPIALNRLADGLDGTLARLSAPTDRGAFLDIALDFLFYASIPLAFALADPAANALAAAVLLFAFMGTASSFLAFAVLAAKRGLASVAYPQKGFYYLGGLTEATETLTVFTLMCLVPSWFAPLALGFAGLCALTTITRITAGVQMLGADAGANGNGNAEPEPEPDGNADTDTDTDRDANANANGGRAPQSSPGQPSDSPP